MKKLVLFFCLIIFINVHSQSKLTSVLNDKYDISLRPEIGDISYYKLERINIFIDDKGEVNNNQKFIIYFTRECSDYETGLPVEKYTFDRFYIGANRVLEEIEMKQVKTVEGFTFKSKLSDSEILEKIDYSSIPKTFESLMFMIMTWDVITFDGLTRTSEDLEIPKFIKIGDEFISKVSENFFKFDFEPILRESHYRFIGKDKSIFKGISIVNNEPAAIMFFMSEYNEISMDMNLMNINQLGREFFYGNSYISLNDGKILKGELVSPVYFKQRMGRGEDAQTSNFLVIQKLFLNLLSKSDYYNKIEI